MPVFQLMEPPWRSEPRWPKLAPPRSAQPASLAREISLTQSAARLPLPPSRRPFTPSVVRQFRSRRGVLPRLHGAREQQIGCCHVCASNCWTWRGECSCGTSAQQPHTRFRGRPVSSAVDHVTAWIPRTTPEPARTVPTPPPPVAAPVFVFHEDASKRSAAEQSAIDWAENLQQSIDAEEQRQVGHEAPVAASPEDTSADAQEHNEVHVEGKGETDEQPQQQQSPQPQPPQQQQPRNQKGRNSPRRLTRQMTLARELSTDEKNPKSKTLRDVDAAGTTAWVGGLPYELAVDETALHGLLSEHGGNVTAITVRLKPPAVAGGPNKSWCFATFTNADAIQRLQDAAVVAAEPSPTQPKTEPRPRLELNQPFSPQENAEEILTPLVTNEDVEYTFDNKLPLQSPSSCDDKGVEGVAQQGATVAGDMLSLEASWPPTIIVKKANVERTLFTRKLEAILKGRLKGMKMDRGLLSKSNTSVGQLAQKHHSAQNQAQNSKLLERSPLPRN